MTDERTELVMPWEPVVKQNGWLFVQGIFEPDEPRDPCEYCGESAVSGSMVSSGDNCFCSWDCLVAQAKKYPQFYVIERLV